MTAPAAPRPELLDHHLAAWLGAWPPADPIQVVGSQARQRPGWDEKVHVLIGVTAPGLGTVLSVPPESVVAVEDALRGVQEVVPALQDSATASAVAAAVGAPDTHLGRGVFRVAAAVPGRDRLPDIGLWVEPDDPRVPEWLRPFNGGVLLHLRDDGSYGAGVGVKAHDAIGREISVGTAEDLRGDGLATRLVARAARDIIERDHVPTYLHDPANEPSARVADAAGFPDRGWHVWGLFGP